jgi:hypothetical protein
VYWLHSSGGGGWRQTNHRISESKKMIPVGHIARMDEKRNTYRFLWNKREETNGKSWM